MFKVLPTIIVMCTSHMMRNTLSTMKLLFYNKHFQLESNHSLVCDNVISYYAIAY